MTTTDSLRRSRSAPAADGRGRRSTRRPLVSVVIPAYNEAAIIEDNLATICRYLDSLGDDYRWEVVLVNDGSTDETGRLAEALALTRDNVRVLHHLVNRGLGQALRTAIDHCRGEYIVTLDLDLSYSPDHIPRLLARLRETGAMVVVASPYREGGRISNVPWLRRTLSVWANRFLARAARGGVATLTGMVRAYDGRFLKSLSLRSDSMDINPEAIYKSMILHADIEEVPAHLDWQAQNRHAGTRRSGMRVLRHVLAILLTGFLFRPFMWFILPGLALLVFALYVNTWTLIHFVDFYRGFSAYTWLPDRASAAVAAAYHHTPHTFIVGLMSLMLAIQLISLGILALQSKRYFEEIFYLGTAIRRATRRDHGID